MQGMTITCQNWSTCASGSCSDNLKSQLLLSFGGLSHQNFSSEPNDRTFQCGKTADRFECQFEPYSILASSLKEVVESWFRSSFGIIVWYGVELFFDCVNLSEQKYGVRITVYSLSQMM